MANLLTPKPPAACAALGLCVPTAWFWKRVLALPASQAGLEHIGRRPPGRTDLHPKVTEGTQIPAEFSAIFFQLSSDRQVGA